MAKLIISAPDAFSICIAIIEVISLDLSLVVLQVALIAASETLAVSLTTYRVPCKTTVGRVSGAKEERKHKLLLCFSFEM